MKTTWKSKEEMLANLFGSTRRPLSGGNSKTGRDDSLHPKLFIECKYRQSHSVWNLYRKVEELAKKELRTPLIGLAEKNQQGILLAFNSNDLQVIVDEHLKAQSKVHKMPPTYTNVHKSLKDRYQKHVKKWSKCELCPLHITRTQAVHFRGAMPCDILFIGEAPELSEDSIGYPFVGESGILLQELIYLASFEVTKSVPFSILHYPGTLRIPGKVSLRYAMINPVACMPKRNTKPSQEEIEICSPRVAELLELLSPKIIIRLGNVAKTTHLPKSISSLTSELRTIHPAYALRKKSETLQNELKGVIKMAIEDLTNAYKK